MTSPATPASSEPPGAGPVLFDGAILDRGPWTGVAQGFVHGLRAYGAISPVPPVLLLAKGAPDPGAAGVRIHRGPTDALRRGSMLRRLAREFGCSLLHSPVTSMPRGLPCPAVVTTHDIPWHHPEVLGEGSHRRARAALRRALQQAAGILAPSGFTATDVQREALHLHREGTLPHWPVSVRIIPHGIPVPGDRIDPDATGRHVLVLAGERPRKNLDRMAAAHRLAAAEDPTLPPLEIVGPGRRYVSERDKAQLIRSARIVAVPSLLEGFGLPVLEAMGHGVPVVAARQEALEETAAGAAVWVDPMAPEDIARGLLTAHRDLALRNELGLRGRKRAQFLTPERVARRWLALHAELQCAKRPEVQT